MSKAISEIFDVEPVVKTLPIVQSGTPDITDDAAYAAENIRKLIEIGMESLQEAAAVATTSESPRAYEVVSTMIKGLSDMNLQLLDIHAKKKSISSESPSNQIGTTTNNAIFVGTTKDINELIMQRLNSK